MVAQALLWTPEEDAKLRRLIANDCTWNEIIADFNGTRSRGALDGRASKLGLRLTPEGFRRAHEAPRAVRESRQKRQSWKSKTNNVSRLMSTNTADMARDWLVRVGKHQQVYHRIVHSKREEGVYQVGRERMSRAEMIDKARRIGFNG